MSIKSSFIQINKFCATEIHQDPLENNPIIAKPLISKIRQEIDDELSEDSTPDVEVYAET